MLAILLDYWLWESSSKKYFGPTIQHIYRKENMPAVQEKKRHSTIHATLNYSCLEEWYDDLIWISTYSQAFAT